MPGVPLLTAQLGAGARLAVEVAWGADLTTAMAGWVWTDITSSVRMDPGLALRHGRNDEASNVQPAQCSMILNNSTGAYSRGGQSPNWPFVRRNTPLRVSVDATGLGTFETLFIGYADSWQPTWDQSAHVATVALTASGILRRLEQHDSPVQSSLRRELSNDPTVVAYWPLEEGKKTTDPQSAIPGHPPMEVYDTVVEFGADTSTFDSSVQSPKIVFGALAGPVPLYTPTSEWQTRLLMKFSDDGTKMTDTGVMLRVLTDRVDIGRFDVLWRAGGMPEVRTYDAAGTLLTASGAIGGFSLIGKAGRFVLEVKQNGVNVDWKVVFQSTDELVGAPVGSGSVAGTLGRVTRVFIAPDGNHTDLVVGHLVVQKTITSVFSDFSELSAYVNEYASTRFNRLCDENGIAKIALGDGMVATPLEKMGVQKPQSLLALLREVEAAGDSILYDGDRNEGLVLWTRRARENRTPSMTIATSQLATPLQPVDDDADLLNRAQVTRQDGGSTVAEDITGPLGTNAVGTYDASTTLNVAADTSLPDFASWYVHKGTIEGYRYPSIDLDLKAAPSLVASWLTISGPGQRIDITGPELVAAGHPTGTIELEVQGYSQVITPYSWKVSINCAPYQPWRIIRLAADTGDTSEFTARLDTDGSTVASAASAGATSLSVATTTGPLWTTAADDFPLVVEVGGIAVTVTAISGASSPQTFTVTGSTVTKALAAGLALDVYRPTVLGL